MSHKEILWDTKVVDETVPAYVLSHNFYLNDVTTMTLLEKVTMACIRGESISNIDLDTLIDELPILSESELFYQLILITAFLKIKLGEV